MIMIRILYTDGMKYMLMRRIHVSWMIAVMGAAIFIGVWAAKYIALGSFGGVAWLLTGLLLCLSCFFWGYRWMIILVIVGGLLIGLWRGSGAGYELTVYQQLLGKTVILSGTVADDSDTDKQGNTRLRLKDITFGDHHLPGQLWVVLAKNAPIERSDRVTVSGKLSEGFGTFSGTMYRASLKQVVRPEPGDVALHVRDWFSGLVRRAIPEPESALGVGFLVGQRRNLPEALDTALKIAGLTHIVVASGYNLTILVRLARRLFEKVSKYLATVTTAGLVVSFVAVTGLSPSMSRAGLVTGLSLAAWYYGRKFHPIVLLSIAVAMTVLINPSYAWGDIGWQLSFAAFAGVMILAPLLQAFYFGDKKPSLVRQILGETIAATLMAAPILISTFGYISNVAIIANLLILPLVPLAMLLTFIAGVGTLIFAAGAAVFGFPAYLLLMYMVQTTEFFAGLSWAKTELTVGPWQVGGLYALLIGFMVYMWWRTKFNLRDANLVE